MSENITLTVTDPAGKSQEIVVQRFPFTVGRLGDSDLLLPDSRISRRQARIVEEDNEFYLENESRNGTLVNGERITRHRLQTNDRIEFNMLECYTIVFSNHPPDIRELLERLRVAPEPGPVGELQELKAMLDVSRVFHAGLALDDILTQVVDSCVQVAQADRGMLLLRDETGQLAFRVVRDRNRKTLRERNPRISKTVVDRAIKSRQYVIHTDVGGVAGDPLAAQDSIADLKLRTLICLPLLRMQVITAWETAPVGSSAEVIGVLYMDSRRPASAFSSKSREVLQTLCLEASSVVDGARLLALSRNQEKLEHELRIARAIQRQLLPRTHPESSPVEIFGITIACHEVGGDFYDTFDLGGGRCGVVIADVAGKGMPAALLASMLQGVFWATASAGGPPAEVAARVNQYVCDRSTWDKYATLFYAIFGPADGLQCVNAGHTPPILVTRDGRTKTLPSDSQPIGLLPEAEHFNNVLEIQRGETLVMYTDGVTEAKDTAKEMYGEDRLRDFLTAACGQGLEQLCDGLVRNLKAFTGGELQSDDITIMVARRA